MPETRQEKAQAPRLSGTWTSLAPVLWGSIRVLFRSSEGLGSGFRVPGASSGGKGFGSYCVLSSHPEEGPQSRNRIQQKSSGVLYTLTGITYQSPAQIGRRIVNIIIRLMDKILHYP